MAKLRLSAPQAIILSFACMIAVGTCLLVLPVAARSGVSVGWSTALFTATSANCVTGLVVVPTTTWSPFGQVVILLLIQLGGIGFITVVTGGLLALHRHLSLRQRLQIQASFNQRDIGGMVHLVGRVLRYTFTLEAAGAVLLTVGFLRRGVPLGRALWYGGFHAVSAFCNAGFDVLGTTSLAGLRGDGLITGTIACLIVLGGLGFPVLVECRHRQWSLHSKLVLTTTAALLVLGAGLMALVEWHNPATLGPLSVPGKLGAAGFESVTLRTAGFFTIDQGGLTDIGKLIAGGLMFIGGSPASTAGGVKTITLAVLVIAVAAALRGQPRLNVWRRQLPAQALAKALAITGSLWALIAVSVLVLHFSEGGPVIDLWFEVTSAAATVGLTTGLTPDLSEVGRGVIILCMFVGRLTPLTLTVALAGRQRKQLVYPEAEVFSG